MDILVEMFMKKKLRLVVDLSLIHILYSSFPYPIYHYFLSLIHIYYKSVFEIIKKWNKEKSKIIIWGVSFALLEFTEKYQIHLDNAIIIETGGMKGKREEMTRDELHEKLKNAFSIENIASEYGMLSLIHI